MEWGNDARTRPFDPQYNIIYPQNKCAFSSVRNETQLPSFLDSIRTRHISRERVPKKKELNLVSVLNLECRSTGCPVNSGSDVMAE